MDLHLNLKKEYFDEIKKGTKKIEYRSKNQYW
ncbi:ASCH domain-containing protein, partial [uncultured Fusobacterium sp.]